MNEQYVQVTFGYVQEHILARGIFAPHGAFDAVSCHRHLAAAICGAALGRRPMAGAHPDGRSDFARLPSKITGEYRALLCKRDVVTNLRGKIRTRNAADLGFSPARTKGATLRLRDRPLHTPTRLGGTWEIRICHGCRI